MKKLNIALTSEKPKQRPDREPDLILVDVNKYSELHIWIDEGVEMWRRGREDLLNWFSLNTEDKMAYYYKREGYWEPYSDDEDELFTNVYLKCFEFLAERELLL